MQFQNKSIVQVQQNPGNRPRLEGKQENIVFFIKLFHSSHTKVPADTGVKDKMCWD